MADQVPREGAGGGEQVPATKVAPPVTTEAGAPVPQEQIPPKAEPRAEENNKEATLQQAADNAEVKPSNATTSPVAPGQEKAEEKKVELTSPAVQNNNQEPPKVEEKPLAAESVSEEKPVAAESVAEEKPVAAESVAEEKPVAAESVAEEKPVAAESVAEEKPFAAESVAEAGDANVKSNGVPKESEDWQKRESELLKKIEELEKVKNARSEDGMKLELDLREKEIELLKARVKSLETELQAALARPGGKNREIVENIKQQHEELLSKARGMIFDKTKMVKNQELQIEALMTQVQSLKDINVITKDLLEIRNSEVKAMDERFLAMEARFKAEKERYDLVLKRAQTSTNINDDLRKEYETQLAIFKELREKYELRVQALVAENNRLKEAAKGAGVGAGPST